MTDRDEIKLDRFHWHEMIDRVHVVRCMFDDHIADHPCASYEGLRDDIDQIQDLLWALYQKAGAIDHKENGE